jgi:S1-C subfamily serine protease
MALIFILILAACTQGTAANGISDQTVPSTDPVRGALQESIDLPVPVTNGTSAFLVQESLSTVGVVKALAPSVVQIVTEARAMDMFNQPVPSRGVGTGIILDGRGHILTNNHVITGAQRITVTLSNGESFPAQKVGGDALTDVAVIRIDAAGVQAAMLGRSSDLQVGQEVIAIGHALGLTGGPTVSKGVVSALGRSIDTSPRNTMVDLIQTDAAINPGNSGGPLANTRGEIIGMNTAVIQGGQGIGFAINIDDAKIVAAQLMERGYVERGFLGIAPFNMSLGLADQLGVPVTEGILLVRVVPDSGAAKAGLSEEDVIVQMGGEPIRNTGDLSKFMIDNLPGETVTIVFFRGTDRKTTQATLGELPKG